MTRDASDGTKPPDQPDQWRMRGPYIAHAQLDLRQISDRVVPRMPQRAERHDQREREQREQPTNNPRRSPAIARQPRTLVDHTTNGWRCDRCGPPRRTPLQL